MNSRPGELVFHAWWDQFPHLFFWSPRNDYVGGMAEESSLVLRRDFRASFVLLHRQQNPRLEAHLNTQAGFVRVFDDGTDVVYRVQYDAGLRPGGAP